MKRTWLILLVCLLSLAAARDSAYLGLRFSVAPPLYASDGPLSLGLQVGVPLSERLEIRAALESAFVNSAIYADLLYSREIRDDVRWYVGGGPDYSTHSVPAGDGSSYGVHVTAGVEAIDVLGLFAEVQPAFAFGPSAFWGRLGVGLNLDF